ncbi:MAG: orotidine 5-phosphate decarboxylase [Sulfitobacter sp.]
MTQRTVKMTDVIYNGATQSFEALVTVTTAHETRKYPCAIEAPINMTFDQAAKGLETKALRLHNKRYGMYSQMKMYAPSLRAGREKFDPRRWLQQLGLTAQSDVA